FLKNNILHSHLFSLASQYLFPHLCTEKNEWEKNNMIEVRGGLPEHVAGISRVCSEGCLDTYKGIRSLENITRNNQTFYNHKRILHELNETEGWDGYFVALDGDEVVGAIGGGMTDENISEIFVLYMDPERRGEG